MLKYSFCSIKITQFLTQVFLSKNPGIHQLFRSINGFINFALWTNSAVIFLYLRLWKIYYWFYHFLEFLSVVIFLIKEPSIFIKSGLIFKIKVNLLLFQNHQFAILIPCFIFTYKNHQNLILAYRITF